MENFPESGSGPTLIGERQSVPPSSEPPPTMLPSSVMLFLAPPALHLTRQRPVKLSAASDTTDSLSLWLLLVFLLPLWLLGEHLCLL